MGEDKLKALLQESLAVATKVARAASFEGHLLQFSMFDF
jgi:hypothetical protein